MKPTPGMRPSSVTPTFSCSGPFNTRAWVPSHPVLECLPEIFLIRRIGDRRRPHMASSRDHLAARSRARQARRLATVMARRRKYKRVTLPRLAFLSLYNANDGLGAEIANSACVAASEQRAAALTRPMATRSDDASMSGKSCRAARPIVEKWIEVLK